MRLRRTELFGAAAIAGGALILFACSGGEDYPTFAEGGAPSTGGVMSNTGGTAPSTGGVAPSTGGFSTGGFPSTTGGTAPSTGGTFSTGGSSTGGKGAGTTGGTIFGNTGGSKSTGGASAGGAGGKGSGGTGGKGSGGSAGAGAGGKGGASSGGAGGAGTVAFTQVVSYIRTQCGTCHAGTQAPNLSTTNPTTLYTTLTTATVRQCATNKLVTAGDPSKSALLMMSIGQCGTFRMPNGCTTNASCISTADQAMLTSWIQAGAKNP